MPESPKNPQKVASLTNIFSKAAEKVSRVVGSPWWFAFSIFIVVVWVLSGNFFESKELWHLQINTSTTILTFLMMSLLHASQSRWEKKMEKMQQREGTELKEIREEFVGVEKNKKDRITTIS